LWVVMGTRVSINGKSTSSDENIEYGCFFIAI
jgi:hypothetical protein